MAFTRPTPLGLARVGPAIAACSNSEHFAVDVRAAVRSRVRTFDGRTLPLLRRRSCRSGRRRTDGRRGLGLPAGQVLEQADAGQVDRVDAGAAGSDDHHVGLSRAMTRIASCSESRAEASALLIVLFGPRASCSRTPRGRPQFGRWRRLHRGAIRPHPGPRPSGSQALRRQLTKSRAASLSSFRFERDMTGTELDPDSIGIDVTDLQAESFIASEAAQTPSWMSRDMTLMNFFSYRYLSGLKS